MRPLARRLGWSLVVTGIGGDAVRRALAAAPGDGVVVLAGVAGALRGAPYASGTAWTVREVVTNQGILTSPLLSEGIRVTQAEDIVATPRDKSALANQTGADIVDMESSAFASAAQSAGRRWAIVRGISDGIEHSLPPGCDQWFNPQGGIRPVRAAADLIRSPIDLVHILQFARRTMRAMRALSDLAQQHAELITCGESV